MKKVFMTLAVILMGLTAANAQLVIGGDIAFSGKAPDVKKNSIDGLKSKSSSDFGFVIAPKVGYLFLEQRLEIGAQLAFMYDQTMNYKILRNEKSEEPKSFKDYKEMDFSWAINPYARYCVARGKGFGLWIEGLASLGTEMWSQTHYYAYKYNDKIIGRSEKEANQLNSAEKQDAKNHSCFNGALIVQPVLTYDINEHWRLETTLGFLGFNLNGQVKSEKLDNGSKNTTNTCNFDLNVLSDNVATVGKISIGVAYKF